MPSFKIQLPHTQSQEEVISRLSQFVLRMEKEFSGKITQSESSWIDNKMTFSFIVSGFRISGEMTIEDHEVIVDGRVPLLAAPFMGRVEREIEKALADELASMPQV